MALAAANEPGAHQAGSAAPVAHAAPAGHSMQSSLEVIERASVVFWWRPDGHGRGAAAPSAQYEPATHSKHAVLPLSFMNVPAAQAAQLPWLVCGCTVPGLHAIDSAAPVEQNDPDGHATQSSSLVIEMPSVVIVPFW